ncbi:nuclear export factor GLE1 [Mycobacterium kubicae]|nr:nuclear export factor GLE1 [Mycobacterium kubicae]
MPVRVMSVAAVLWLGAVALASPVWAHVRASSDQAVRGAMAVVTFQVPNESATSAATTALTVALPNVGSARAEAVPGWTATLDRDVASGGVRSVTWTAAPNGGVPPDQFGLFRISLQLPDAATVSFPTTQTYSDGLVVKWDQPPLPGGAEPEHPAPLLTLTAGAAAPASQPPADRVVASTDPRHPRADNTARWLGGTALIIGAMGIGLALRRRT